MYRSAAFALFALAVTALSAAAHAATEVRVLETYPEARDVALANGQTFYLRLGYTTDEPVHIWVRPFFDGREVRAGSNPSRTYTGSGEALGWFFLMEPGQQVDEVRIRVGDGSPDGTHFIAAYPIRISGSARPAAAASEPAWVVSLRQENERLQREEYAQRMSTPPGAGETLFFGGFMLAVLALGIAGVGAPLWALRHWQGGWRLAAAVPAVMIGFVVLRIVVGVADDPTSHNLWPFEILQVGALSLVVIGVLLAVRKFSGVQA